jgi:hypothetical protein
MISRIASLAAVAALAMACSTVDSEDEDEESRVDMFACGVSYDCIQDVGHLGPIPEEAVRCGGELVASGDPGAVLMTSQPGPYPTEFERLVVVLGNGKALQQSRTRCAVEGGCGQQSTTQWSLSPLEICDVQVAPEAIAGCGDPNGTCEWYAGGVNCAPAEETWTCAELP